MSGIIILLSNHLPTNLECTSSHPPNKMVFHFVDYLMCELDDMVLELTFYGVIGSM